MGFAKYLISCALISLLGLIAFIPEASAQQATTQFIMDDPSVATDPGLNAQARVAETGYFDTNPLLQTTKTKSLWGSITSPELLIDDISPMTTIKADTVFVSNNFNQSNFDSSDVHEKFNVSRQNQMWTLGMQGNFDYDTTRTSELSIYNNLQTTPIRHIGGYAAPSLTYNFLPTDHLGVTGNYSESSYAGNTSFQDYNTYSISPSYVHDFDPLNSGTLSLTAQGYRALSGQSSTTDSVGPQVGWNTTLTDQLKGNVAVGFEEVRTIQQGIASSAWQTEYTMSGGINFTGEQDLASAQISRNEYPFGNGTEALLTQFAVNEEHALNQLFSVAGAVSYQGADYQTNSPGSLDSLSTGTLSFIYHVTNKVNMTASYEYEYETLVDFSSTAQKHVGLLNLSYTPQNWNLR